MSGGLGASCHCTASAALTHFLSLNDDYIVFRGNEHESASAHLKGTLVLCLSEPLAIKHLRLQLTGMSRVWYELPYRNTLNFDQIKLFEKKEKKKKREKENKI